MVKGWLKMLEMVMNLLKNKEATVKIRFTDRGFKFEILEIKSVSDAN